MRFNKVALTEADRVDFKLPADKMFDPKSLDLKGMAAAAKRDADEKEEAERKAKEFAENKEKYKDIIEKAKSAETVEDQLTVLHDELVPGRGFADTQAGELVRAMMRILYRDYNDGDLFYEGYGIETCGGSVAYLIDQIEDLYDHFDRIADAHLEDNDYTRALEAVADDVLKYIYSHDEVWMPNEEDSRSSLFDRLYEDDYREDWEPKYDYDFSIPDTIKAHIEAGNIYDIEFQNVVESDLESSNIKFDSVEVWSDTVYVYGLDRDGYDELERGRWWDDASWDSYIEELEDEYGDPNEDDEDEDEDELEESAKPHDKYQIGQEVLYNGKKTTIRDIEFSDEFGYDLLIDNPDFDPEIYTGDDAWKYEKVWVGDKVEVLESAMSDRIRKNDLEGDDGSYWASEDNIDIDIQDRETHTHEFSTAQNRWGRSYIDRKKNKQPKVASHTVGKIWKDGKFDKSFEGPKYKVRADMAKYLDEKQQLMEDANDQIIVGFGTDRSRKYYNKDTQTWEDDKANATIFKTNDEARDVWFGLDKKPFKRVFICVNDENV